MTAPRVFFPGFRQIGELPRYYSGAACFVHPAISEPWGLVINEAMACGLPILASRNAGASEELIEDGINGWRFDPSSKEAIADALRRLTGIRPEELKRMGMASARILGERCPTEAFGIGLRSCLEAGSSAASAEPQSRSELASSGP